MNLPQDPIDLAALQDLKEIMESEFETLIVTFINDSEQRIGQIREHLAAQKAEDLRKSAHSLKGSSSNVCAKSLSEIAREIEFRASQQQLDQLDSLVNDLDAEFKRTAQFLSAMLDN